MSKLIAYCGLDCSECIAYKATINDDQKELEKIASLWGDPDEEFSVEDIKCHGCSSNLLNKNCNVCEIRNCGKAKGLNNCGECVEFVCEKLTKEWSSWHNADPVQAKKNLEEFR